jgi:DNA-binding transcriptional regulator YiaG
MYHYRESGLDNILLVNGFCEEDTPYGRVVSFDNIEGLHKAIGHWLVTLPRPLHGAEMRFLRHELDLSQKRLAIILGVSEITIRRWEAGRYKPIPSTAADRFLRVTYSSWTDGRESTRELIDMLAEMDQVEVEKREEVRFKESKRRWLVDHNGEDKHTAGC